MQDIYISIGQNIRRRRKEKHLTQESLAANVETSAQYISRIERGQVCPSLEFLYRLSAALECPIYSLLPSTVSSQTGPNGGIKLETKRKNLRFLDPDETAALLRIMYIVPEEERVYIRSILRDLALIDDK